MNGPLRRLLDGLATIDETLERHETEQAARDRDLYLLLDELRQTLERIANSADEIVARLDRQPDEALHMWRT